MDNNSQTKALVRRLETEQKVVIRSAQQLTALREALLDIISRSGYAIEFDPTSDKDLVDYLAVGAARSLEGAAVGVLAGALVGAMFGAPKEGAKVGGLIGTIFGLANGIDRVERGWRIHAVRTPHGAPLVTVMRRG